MIDDFRQCHPVDASVRSDFTNSDSSFLGKFLNEVVLQLGEDDLPLLCCVCLGYLPKAEFKRPTKGITIERQPGRIYLAASQGSGTGYALPLPISQSFQLGALALAQLKKQSVCDDEQLVLAALRGAAALYKG